MYFCKNLCFVVMYRGCADSLRWHGLDLEYNGCQYQQYMGWNHHRALWCLCAENRCNRVSVIGCVTLSIGEWHHGNIFGSFLRNILHSNKNQKCGKLTIWLQAILRMQINNKLSAAHWAILTCYTIKSYMSVEDPQTIKQIGP